MSSKNFYVRDCFGEREVDGSNQWKIFWGVLGPLLLTVILVFRNGWYGWVMGDMGGEWWMWMASRAGVYDIIFELGRGLVLQMGDAILPPIVWHKMLTANQIKGFLDQQYFPIWWMDHWETQERKKNQDSQLIWMLPGLLRHFQMCWNSWKAPLRPPDAFTGIKNSLDQGSFITTESWKTCIQLKVSCLLQSSGIHIDLNI